jgi:hypothetical protein
VFTALSACGRRSRLADADQLELRPELPERRLRPTRKLPLGDPQLVRDLLAAEISDVAQVEDLLLRRGERAEGSGELQPLVAQVQLARAVGRPNKERIRVAERMHAPGLAQVGQVVGVDVELGRQLAVGGRAPEPRSQLSARLGQPSAGLLEWPRQPQGGGAVSDVALHLADDGRHGEGGELLATAAVIALNCVEQPDGADLDKVVVLRGAALVAVGEFLD